MKITYVVLHYLATQDTLECVNSILNNVKSKAHETYIVVIDNGSLDNSYACLKEAFKEYPEVALIKSDENLGFARGNNLGYQYAKYKIKADFIVLLNNDTIISQQNFSDVIVRKYDEKQYSVLGPDIITADGLHQNPGRKQSWSFKELRIYRLKKQVRILLSYLHLDAAISRMIGRVKEVYRTETLKGDVENTILHGACLIFSPLYVKQFEGLHEETFLYMEEDILKLYADFYGFLMLYSSELQIFHKEDIATNMIKMDDDKKIRLKYRRLIDSSKIYSGLKKGMIANQKSRA